MEKLLLGIWLTRLESGEISVRVRSLVRFLMS